MTDEMTAQSVIDCLLAALAAQLDTSGVLAAGAVEAFADLGRAQTGLIFGQAGHLVHYGEPEPLQTLLNAISAVQRREAPADAAIRPGDEVRLVGELPESLARYSEALLRKTVYVVRYVGQDSTIDLQPHLYEDYVIETVPAVNVEPVQR